MPKLSVAEQSDMDYYGIVRYTLTAIDGHRLTASIYGTIIPLTIVLAAATISTSFEKPFGYVYGAGLYLIAIVIAEYFKSKIDLFNHFVSESVSIGLRIEEELELISEIRITKQFELHKRAGERGGRLLLGSVIVIQLTAAIAFFIETFVAIKACIFG